MTRFFILRVVGVFQSKCWRYLSSRFEVYPI